MKKVSESDNIPTCLFTYRNIKMPRVAEVPKHVLY